MANELPVREAGGGCCRVEAVVPVDGRGQLVLPKDVRERAGLRAGDKLAVTTVERDGAVCCILLTPAHALTAAVRSALQAAADPGPHPEGGNE